MSFKFCLKNS